MPITHIQTVNSGDAGDVTTAQVTVTLTGGNAVIAHVCLFDAVNVTSFVSSPSNTFVQRFNAVGGGTGRCLQYSCLSVANGSTQFTVTIDATSGYPVIFITEVSGLAAFDQAATNAGDSGTPPTSGATGTLAVPNELVIAGFSLRAPSTYGIGSGYISPTNGDHQASYCPSVMIYQIVSSTASVNAALTGTNTYWAGGVGTYTEAAPTGLSITQTEALLVSDTRRQIG